MRSGETALWRGVVWRSLRDSWGIFEFPRYSNPAYYANCERYAKNWLKLGNRDFNFVCSMASVVPSEIIRIQALGPPAVFAVEE